MYKVNMLKCFFFGLFFCSAVKHIAVFGIQSEMINHVECKAKQGTNAV